MNVTKTSASSVKVMFDPESSVRNASFTRASGKAFEIRLKNSRGANQRPGKFAHINLQKVLNFCCENKRKSLEVDTHF